MPRFFGGRSSSTNCSSDDGSRRAPRFDHVLRRLRNESPLERQPSFCISVLEVRQDKHEEPVDGGTIHWKSENNPHEATRYSIHPKGMGPPPSSHKQSLGRSQSAQPSLLRPSFFRGSSFRRGRRSFQRRRTQADISKLYDEESFPDLVDEPGYRPRRSHSDLGAYYFASPNSAVRFRADAITFKRNMEEERKHKREQRELFGIDDDDELSDVSNYSFEDNIIKSCVSYPEEEEKMDPDASQCLMDSDPSCGEIIDETLLELENPPVDKSSNRAVWYDFSESCVLMPFLCRVFVVPEQNAESQELYDGEHIIEFTREEEEDDTEEEKKEDETKAFPFFTGAKQTPMQKAPPFFT